MDTLGAALAAWIGFHASIGVDLEAYLRPGTTDAALDRVESEIGFDLPGDLRALYRRADGQLSSFGDDWPDPERHGAAMFGRYDFLPLDEALREYWSWLEMYSADEPYGGFDVWDVPEGDPVAPMYVAPGRFPFASDRNGNYLAVDPSPLRGGEIGQVIRYGADYGDVRVLAPSVTALMDQLARELDPDEAARFTYNDASPATEYSPAYPPTVEFEIDLREPVHEPYVPTARVIADNAEWGRQQDVAREAFLSWLAGRGLDGRERQATLDALGMVWKYVIPPHPSEPPEAAQFRSFEFYLLEIESQFYGATGREQEAKAALALFHAYQLERGVWTIEQRAEADAALDGVHPPIDEGSGFDFEIRSSNGTVIFGGRAVKSRDVQ